VKRSSQPRRPPEKSDARLRTAPARLADAHYDRVILVPTAETNPEGSFYFSSYEILLLQIGYAVSDTTQISVTSAPPIAEGTAPFDLSVKTVLLREPSVQAAFFGSASGVVGSELAGFIGRGGGSVTLCHPAYECRHRVTVASSVFLAGPASLLLSGVGASLRVNRMFTLLAELDSAVPLGEPVGEFNGVLGGFGARFSDPNWGVDLCLMRSGTAGALSPFFPFLALTYRYVP
jgi:hypothetical protein